MAWVMWFEPSRLVSDASHYALLSEVVAHLVLIVTRPHDHLRVQGFQPLELLVCKGDVFRIHRYVHYGRFYSQI